MDFRNFSPASNFYYYFTTWKICLQPQSLYIVIMDDSPKSVNFQVVKNIFWKLFFQFSSLKSIAEVYQRPNMLSTQLIVKVEGCSVLKFQRPDRWNSISLVPEKLFIRLNPMNRQSRVPEVLKFTLKFPVASAHFK